MPFQHSVDLTQGEHCQIRTTHFQCDDIVSHESLSKMVEYISAWVARDFPNEIAANAGLRMLYPLTFTFRDSEVLSELRFWQQLADYNSGADALLLQYIQELESIDADLRVDLWSDELHQYGLIPIQAQFERKYINGNLSREIASEFVEAFTIYIDKICDFNSETIEDDYITRVLRSTRDSDRSSHLKILSIRLLRGQYGLDARGIEYLNEFLGPRENNEKALLRPFLEYLAKFHSEEWLPDGCISYDLPYLLSAIYGSQASVGNDICQALSKLTGNKVELNPPHQYMKEAIERNHRTADYRLKNSKVDVYTGFHRYSSREKCWHALT